LASVRVTKVGGAEYLQVVEYDYSGGQAKTKVLNSFGRNTLENRLRAEQYAAEYDRLKGFAGEFAKTQPQNNPPNDLVNTALAVFGIVLGAAVVIAVLNEIFGSHD